ncbi:MAG: laccase domain-containing protein [Ignavibacteria bacterium]|nr:laccase domain-containing protein [Ignavibacteria bacterium]
MIIIKSSLFSQFPEIKLGFSTKTGLNRSEPYYFNMSLSVGDNPDIVKANRS